MPTIRGLDCLGVECKQGHEVLAMLGMFVPANTERQAKTDRCIHGDK